MTIDEYLIELGLIDVEYHKKVNALRLKYITIHSKYKEGDIIEDHFHKIKINMVSFSYNRDGDIPKAIYFGIELDDYNKPKKQQINPIIYGDEIKGGWRK